MAIKFTAKDQVKAAPAAAAKAAAAKTDGGSSPDEAPAAGTDLFDPEPKAPPRKRKR